MITPGEILPDRLALLGFGAMKLVSEDELSDPLELLLDGVEPGRVGRRPSRLHVVAAHERVDVPLLVGGQVIHDDVEPQALRIAGAQTSHRGENVGRCLPATHLSIEAVGVDIQEPKKLLGPMWPSVGCGQAVPLALERPALALDGPQFQRPHLVVGYDAAILGAPRFEALDPFFLTTNSGSGDSFQVPVRWSVTP